ncbi:hypothetical protein OE88DRAFT_1663195 [Heliocybe sulcata]|uniref:Uncharacterized protein n=1 Tax=Heliocybe sulcata TaxID=5364 RepID=A0A5C3MVP1_9AGAM|nr:hypothetical protein OE88DRAFT_1663195 [Heliocybe sulcata]
MRSALILSSLAALAYGQSIQIGAPAAGETITAGSNITVSVFKPNSLTGSTEVSLILAINSCSDGGCQSPSNVLGNVLYMGEWQPDYSNTSSSLPPHQNFTVQVPDSLQNGTATLSASHLALIGAGPYPDLEIVNTTVNVANANGTVANMTTSDA